jgi:hypothetical protein
MKIINIIILLLGIFGGGSGMKFFNERKIEKLEKAHKKEIDFKVDTIATLRQNIHFIVKSDSVKQSQITELQSTMQVLNKQKWKLKIDSTNQAKKIQQMAAWIEDAQDGIIRDTVVKEYNTNFFGKRKRIK